MPPPEDLDRLRHMVEAAQEARRPEPTDSSCCSLEGVMATVSLDLPEEVFSALRRSPEEFGDELRLAAAIHWYERGQISQEKAALLAGLDRTDFLLRLAQEGAEAFVVDFNDLEREMGCG